MAGVEGGVLRSLALTQDDRGTERRPMTAQEILDEPWEGENGVTVLGSCGVTGEKSLGPGVAVTGGVLQSPGLLQDDIAPEEVPLEEVIQAFERMNVPFAMSDLLAQGYRFHDPEWEGYRSPMDREAGLG